MVKEQKTTGTQNRSNRGRKYGRRILCLILALMFTITGLPTGGAMETKAAALTSIMYGRRTYGTFDSSTGLLRVVTSSNSGDIEADSSYEKGIYDSIKEQVKTLEIGVKITELKGFDGLTNLETIEFNSDPVFDSGFLGDLDQILALRDQNRQLTIKLPLNYKQEFYDQLQTKFAGYQNIKYEKQYVLHIINSDSNTKPIDSLGSYLGTTTNNAYYFKYSDSSFTRAVNDQIQVYIQPMRYYTGNMMFYQWVMAGGRGTTESATSITGVSQVENSDITSVSGAAILTLTKDMPAEVFVTAHYKSKDELANIEENKKRDVLKSALDQVENALKDYSNQPENELDSVPTNVAYVQTYLDAILANMKKMTNNVFDFSMTSFEQVENSVQQPTTSTQGTVEYQIGLTANYAGDSIVETKNCLLTLKVKRKQNISYTVIVSGGSIQEATGAETLSSGEFKKTYYLSDIESGGGKLSLKLISTDRTSSNYYYAGWEDIRTDDSETSVRLTDISSTDGNQATGSATLELKEESPLKIYVTAKYKTKSTTTGGGSTGGGSTGGGSTGGGSTGGGWVPTIPTTPEKPKDEEKPKDPEKPTDTEKPAEDPTPASKPISTTTKTNTATVSVSDLQKAVDGKTNAGMTLKYKNAMLTFDAKAVESIAKQAKKIGSSSLKVVCKADAQSSLNSAQKKALENKTVIGCYQVYLKCGNKTISDFGTGKVKVKVPLKLKSGQKSKNVKLYYVDEKGKLTKQTASHSNGTLTFTTTHFSIYAAIYPKQTTTTASDKTATSDKTGTTDKTNTTDKTEKPTQVIGTENETVPGGVVDDSMVGLPKAEEYEQISYHTLQLHLSRSNDTSVCLGWNRVPGASGYELYGARCNTKTKKYEIIQITSLDAPSMTAWMCENLKENTYYKFIVRAYMNKDGEKVYIARSRSAHVSTGGGGYGFIKDVTVDKPQVTLGVGKTTVIKATIDTAAQKIRSHYDLRFESSDSAIATVSSSGKITAKKKGTCAIYVYTQNGLYTTVQVTVR